MATPRKTVQQPKQPTPEEEILRLYGNPNNNIAQLLSAILKELVRARLARG